MYACLYVYIYISVFGTDESQKLLRLFSIAYGSDITVHCNYLPRKCGKEQLLGN